MYYSILELTFTVANATNADVFSVFEQDMSIVIDIINYLIERAERGTAPDPKPQQSTQKKTSNRDVFWDYV